MIESVLPKLDDFDTSAVGPIKGTHGQQIVDALRKLDAKAGYDTSKPHPCWDQFETWPAIVVGLNSQPAESESDAPQVLPGMYWVRKQYVGDGLTADPVNLYNALDDPAMYYPATNVLEILSGTNQVQMGQPVLIMSYVDRGVANRKRYLFIADRPVAWIEITSPMPPYSAGPPPTGGGAYYNASLVTGAPVTIDPTTDLVAPISPNETVGPSNAILAMNWAEGNLGDPPTHWVQCPTFVPAWLIGYTHETPPRPCYRFYIPRPGQQTLTIAGINGSWGGGTGAGSYAVTIGLGSVLGVDPTRNFQPSDPGTSAGTAVGTWRNVFESGSAASGTNLVAEGSTVQGTFVGIDRNGNPCFYGGHLPAGTIFNVKVVQNGGSNGSATTAATWTYDVYLYWDTGGTLQIGSAVTVDAPRFANGLMTAATVGNAYLTRSGVVALQQVYEVHGTVTCA